MASISKERRKGKETGRWKVRWYVDAATAAAEGTEGRQRTKGGFMTKAEAEAFKAKLVHEQHTGEWISDRAGAVPYAEWADQWKHTWRNKRPSTWARDENYLDRYVVAHFGEARLGDITPLAVETWLTRLQAKGGHKGKPLAAATVIKAYQLLNGSLKAAVRHRMIPSNPADGVTLPTIERHEMRFLTEDEIAALADAIDPRYRGFVYVAAYAGLRAGELFALRRQDVDVARRRVRVNQTLALVRGRVTFNEPKTKAGLRSVPLPRFVIDELVRHMREYVDPQSDALLFTSPQGEPMSAVNFRNRVWHKAVKGAGLGHVRLHDMRHTAVALWIDRGANALQLTKWAGHTKVAFTLDRYGHLIDEDGDDVMAALDRGARSAARTGQVVSLHGAQTDAEAS